MKAFEKVSAKQLKKTLQKSALYGLAIDIDDTLAYTDHHYFVKMVELYNPEKLTPRQILQKYRHVRDVPYWQSKKAQRILIAYTESGKFHKDIPLIKDAKKALEKIHLKLPVAAYITGRPASTYRATQDWLRKHKFPQAPIIFRDAARSLKERHLWKANVLNFLYPEVRGIIDDHPDLKQELKSIKYQGQLFLYDNGRNAKTYHHRLRRFQNWSEIFEAIINL